MKLQSYVARLERGWNILRGQGIARFASAGIGFIRSKLGLPSPHQAQYLEEKARADAKFDSELGVSTGGVTYLHDLTIASRNVRFGTNYVPVHPAEFELAMATIDIDVKSATFIDLGCGKGRALIMAARYPFAQIIGVEFARELYETCVANIQLAFPSPGEPGRITALLGDAAEFAFPDQPLVVYLFNPFDAPIMASAARNALASWQAHPRPIRVVYLNPVFAREWSNAGWELVAENVGLAVFAPPAG